MQLELEGQTAVIVGGAQGIGHAIAVGFAEEGANVAVLDIVPDVVDIGSSIGNSHSIRSVGVRCDIADSDEVKRAASSIRTKFGQVDHVINAAAVGSGKFGFPFWNLEPGDWARVLEVNVMGVVHVAHAFAPMLVERGAGSMLFLASVAGQMGSQTDPPYSASKAAVINFVQCAAKDLAPHGVRVNALSPGMVETALNRSVWESWNRRQPDDEKQSYHEWADEKIRNLVPMGRWQKPEEVAAMAVFLASPRAANITGQTLNVDGGYVMHS